jgi:beta-lactamase class D
LFIGYIETGDNTYFSVITQQDESKANGSAAVQIACSIFEKTDIKITV